MFTLFMLCGVVIVVIHLVLVLRLDNSKAETKPNAMLITLGAIGLIIALAVVMASLE